MQVIGEAADGTTIELRVGEAAELRLGENASTGFRWQVRQACQAIPQGFVALGLSADHIPFAKIFNADRVIAHKNILIYCFLFLNLRPYPQRCVPCGGNNTYR